MSGTVKSKPDDNRPRRYDTILTTLLTVLISHPIDLVVIEGYSYMSTGQTLYLAELGGIVKHELYKREKTVVEVPPSTLKKFVTGKGNAKKDQMMLAIYKRWGTEFDNNDAADAYALAQYGRTLPGV